MVTGIELFAGAGGMALGMEQAGIKSKLFVEIDRTACDTLLKNRPDWNVICSDIHDVDFEDYIGIDVVSGGPPCQAFSYAGKRKGFGDIRGTLFAEFARCVNETQPKLFVFENVKGLLNHDGGRTFGTVSHTFEELGYIVRHKVLDACMYGVGQKRERLVMIGVRDDLDISFEYPGPDADVTVLGDVLQNVPESPGAVYSEEKARVMGLVPPGGCWVNLPEDVARAYMKKSYDSGGGKRGIARRLSFNRPCPTLTTSPAQKLTEFCHPVEVRPLSVREYARVQSFPDSWEFAGSMARQYKQIGNAVPVELARRVGVTVVDALRESR